MKSILLSILIFIFGYWIGHKDGETRQRIKDNTEIIAVRQQAYNNIMQCYDHTNKLSGLILEMGGQ